MEGLTALVREQDPDFVTGYNIDNFDLPRMQERAEVISPRPKYSRSPLFGWGRVPMKEGEGKRIFPTRQRKQGLENPWKNPHGRMVAGSTDTEATKGVIEVRIACGFYGLRTRT